MQGINIHCFFFFLESNHCVNREKIIPCFIWNFPKNCSLLMKSDHANLATPACLLTEYILSLLKRSVSVMTHGGCLCPPGSSSLEPTSHLPAHLTRHCSRTSLGLLWLLSPLSSYYTCRTSQYTRNADFIHACSRFSMKL